MEKETMAVEKQIHLTKVQIQLEDLAIRLTEWHEGFQAGAVDLRNPKRAFFTEWLPTELEAWTKLHTLVIEAKAKLEKENEEGQRSTENSRTDKAG